MWYGVTSLCVTSAPLLSAVPATITFANVAETLIFARTATSYIKNTRKACLAVSTTLFSRFQEFLNCQQMQHQRQRNYPGDSGCGALKQYTERKNPGSKKAHLLWYKRHYRGSPGVWSRMRVSRDYFMPRIGYETPGSCRKVELHYVKVYYCTFESLFISAHVVRVFELSSVLFYSP